MFKSVQALQTENDPDDDKVWLTYWCVYGFIIVIDKYEIDFILEMMPGYFLFKLVLYTWPPIPGKWMGARFVYNWICCRN